MHFVFISLFLYVFLGGGTARLCGQASLRLPPPTVGDAQLRLVSPEPESVVNSKDLDVFLDVRNVELAVDGHRVVVLLGGKMRETVTHSLRPATFRGLKPGSYLLRAFVVDRRGAMVRSPAAFVRTYVHIMRPDAELPRANAPLLTVASPEGVISHEDSRLVLFDFMTSNLRLGERGLRLRYRIGDVVGYLSQSTPVLLTGLAPGEHVLFAEVVGEDNKPLPGPYLSAECRFSVLPPPVGSRLALGEETGPVSDVGAALPQSFEEFPRVRVVSPEPGLTVLLDDPAWED